MTEQEQGGVKRLISLASARARQYSEALEGAFLRRVRQLLLLPRHYGAQEHGGDSDTEIDRPLWGHFVVHTSLG